jgi:NADPH-dependent glutamate synthase beta subunit-like oxidoreductase
VKVGNDISVADLQLMYDGIIFCYGAESEKKLNIPGEDALGVYGAKDFVGLINGHPDYT